MEIERALFAAGCFWGVQYYFDQIPGVIRTTAGYTGGHVKNPTYDQVCTHLTGHAEAVLVEFDPERVEYGVLLRHFFRMHNPTLLNSDGVNVGDQYRSAIFYFSGDQRIAAEASLRENQSKYSNPIVTQIVPAGEFYAAEAYHQKFTERTGIGMCHVPYKKL